MRPSSESWPLSRSNGLGAAVTCGWAPISSTVRSIAACRSDSRNVPDSAAKTTFAVSPDSAGKRSSSKSIAACDSVPRVLKSSTNEPPPAPAARPSATSTTATIASERFQWFAAQAARFPRRCAMGREKSTFHAILQWLFVCSYDLFTHSASSLPLTHATGTAGTEEGAHPPADHRGGHGPLRRPRLPGDDDRRHRRRRGGRPPDLLLVLPVEGGGGLPQRRPRPRRPGKRAPRPPARRDRLRRAPPLDRLDVRRVCGRSRRGGPTQTAVA